MTELRSFDPLDLNLLRFLLLADHFFFSLSNYFTSGNKVDDRLMASQVVQGTRFHMGEGGRELFDV